MKTYDVLKKMLVKKACEWILACGENGHVYPKDVAPIGLIYFGEKALTDIKELYVTNSNDIIVVTRAYGYDYDDADNLTHFSLQEMCEILDTCGFSYN